MYIYIFTYISLYHIHVCTHTHIYIYVYINRRTPDTRSMAGKIGSLVAGGNHEVYTSSLDAWLLEAFYEN